MTITAEQMSRITALVAAGASFDKFITSNKIAPEDRDEAEEIWDSVDQTIQNLEPGQQLSVPGEWS